MDSAATPVVTHRKGYTHTITDIASPTRLEVFAALAETRKSLAYAFLVTHGPVWDNFARDLVVWAAPRIPAANKGEALRRCLAEVDAATCSKSLRGRRPDSSDVRALVLEGD